MLRKILRCILPCVVVQCATDWPTGPLRTWEKKIVDWFEPLRIILGLEHGACGTAELDTMLQLGGSIRSICYEYPIIIYRISLVGERA